MNYFSGKYSCLAFLAAIVFIGFLVANKRNANIAAVDKPVVSIETNTWDFGDVVCGPTLVARFTVLNEGARRLVLNKKSTSCDCASTGNTTVMVPPGGCVELTAELNTSHLEGAFAFDVFYTTNDPASPVVSFVLLADVRAASL